MLYAAVDASVDDGCAAAWVSLKKNLVFLTIMDAGGLLTKAESFTDKDASSFFGTVVLASAVDRMVNASDEVVASLTYQLDHVVESSLAHADCGAELVSFTKSCSEQLHTCPALFKVGLAVRAFVMLSARCRDTDVKSYLPLEGDDVDAAYVDIWEKVSDDAAAVQTRLCDASVASGKENEDHATDEQGALRGGRVAMLIKCGDEMLDTWMNELGARVWAVLGAAVDSALSAMQNVVAFV
jgi:hypothetical protein